jgi:hypothetical protein
MNSSVVDRLFQEFNELMDIVRAAGELSLQVSAEETFRKALLMTAASYFEHSLAQEVLGFVARASSGNAVVTSIVEKKAVQRQYHTWFQWDANNANSFFALFGSEFSERMKARISASDQLSGAVEAFLELGRSRNLLVHQNYGVFSLEKTVGEIHGLYISAKEFVEAIADVLATFVEPDANEGERI